MPEPDDISLLRQYTEEDSEEAFGTLVSRHINKVYSVALRHSRNPHQAEEITQAVFAILAKKARSLGKAVVLSGWLYHTARLTSVTFLRSEIRRARREQEAYMQNTLEETASDETWKQIGPQLDTAMARLNDADRNAVVLRFFDGKNNFCRCGGKRRRGFNLNPNPDQRSIESYGLDQNEISRGCRRRSGFSRGDDKFGG
jgi:RNA polymerase sigma factor (sigma-70 family)